jgi:ATP-binding cassette subfamily F protein 3
MPATLLTVTNLSKSFGAEQIFRDVSFQMVEKEHVALVGVNGAGKSTVLKIIAGMEEATSGEVAPATGLRITYLPQEARFDSLRSIREEAQEAFTGALKAAEHMREIEQALGTADAEAFDRLMEEYERLHAHYEFGGGYDIEHRTEEILVGLGFEESQFDTPVHLLSGGQKTRVALAKALLADPDLLLLDEPTNHLDLTMLEWLEGFLRSWNGACLTVSHDRYFLDRVTSRTMELAFGEIEDYPAPYARYLVLRAERRERQQKDYEEQRAFIARTEEFIRKYKAGQRAREAKGRQTRLERVDRPQDHAELGIRIQSTLRSGNQVLTSRPLTIGYRTATDDVVLLKTRELVVERGDTIGLVGPNGAGKTTLLKTLVGEIPTPKGRFETGVNVKVGYYAQAHEQLPLGGTPLSVVLGAQPMGEESARNYLGRFLFTEDDVFKPVSGLSGGERSRLALAVLLLQNANFLILDEPTNHLDIPARETLEELLRRFEGTVLFVSHDRFFTDRIATKIWAVGDGQLTEYLGNYTDYQRALGRRQDATPVKAPQPAPVAPERPVEKRKHQSDGRSLKNIAAAERDISRLEGKLNELSDALAIASIEADVEALARLGTEYERVQADLDAAYERWEELSAGLETVAQ